MEFPPCARRTAIPAPSGTRPSCSNTPPWRRIPPNFPYGVDPRSQCRSLPRYRPSLLTALGRQEIGRVYRIAQGPDSPSNERRGVLRLERLIIIARKPNKRAPRLQKFRFKAKSSRSPRFTESKRSLAIRAVRADPPQRRTQVPLAIESPRRRLKKTAPRRDRRGAVNRQSGAIARGYQMKP
jgi:hypothetical protein